MPAHTPPRPIRSTTPRVRRPLLAKVASVLDRGDEAPIHGYGLSFARGFWLAIAFYIRSRFGVSVFCRPPRDVAYLPSVPVVIACKNEVASIARPANEWR